MSAPDFEFDKVFDPDDYLYFYQPRLSPERTEREVELIWRLLGLAPEMAVLDLACGHGRIANRLAERGCQVVGLDSSPGFLDGRVRRMRFFVRMFTFPALRDWLLSAGFSSVEGFDEQGAALALESRRMLIVATK